MGLDTVEFVLWAKKEFDIEIPDGDAENILTIGQFSAYVHHKLAEFFGTSAISETGIFERIKSFLV